MNAETILDKSINIAGRALEVNALRRCSLEEINYLLTAIKAEVARAATSSPDAGLRLAFTLSLLNSTTYLTEHYNQLVDDAVTDFDKDYIELLTIKKAGA